MAARLGGPPGTSATKRSFRMSHHFAICSRCVPWSATTHTGLDAWGSCQSSHSSFSWRSRTYLAKAANLPLWSLSASLQINQKWWKHIGKRHTNWCKERFYTSMTLLFSCGITVLMFCSLDILILKQNSLLLLFIALYPTCVPADINEHFSAQQLKLWHDPSCVVLGFGLSWERKSPTESSDRPIGGDILNQNQGSESM